MSKMSITGLRIMPNVHRAMGERATDVGAGYLQYAYTLGAFLVLGLNESTYRLLVRQTRGLVEDEVELDEAIAAIRAAFRANAVVDDSVPISGEPEALRETGRGKKKASG